MNATLTAHRTPHIGGAHPSKERPFTLTLGLKEPRIVLSQRGRPSNGHTGETRRLLALEGLSARALLPSVLEHLHKGGFSIARLEEKDGGRLRLSEALGARLALLLWALAPIKKPSRASLVRAGIAAMVEEEVFYWYAKAEGGPSDTGRQRRNNTLKALRVMLAGE